MQFKSSYWSYFMTVWNFTTRMLLGRKKGRNAFMFPLLKGFQVEIQMAINVNEKPGTPLNALSGCYLWHHGKSLNRRKGSWGNQDAERKENTTERFKEFFLSLVLLLGSAEKILASSSFLSSITDFYTLIKSPLNVLFPGWILPVFSASSCVSDAPRP